MELFLTSLPNLGERRELSLGVYQGVSHALQMVESENHRICGEQEEKRVECRLTRGSLFFDLLEGPGG